jgi:hypothetical protein
VHSFDRARDHQAPARHVVVVQRVIGARAPLPPPRTTAPANCALCRLSNTCLTAGEIGCDEYEPVTLRAVPLAEHECRGAL